MKNWYEDTEIIKEVPDFKQTDINGIVGVNYYIDYNELYEEVSFLQVNFILEKLNYKKTIKILFKEVSNLKIDGFGGSYNQLLGFNIKKTDSGYESSKRYLFEDYENNSIQFYFSDFEIVSIK